MGTGALSPAERGRGVKLTTNLQLEVCLHSVVGLYGVKRDSQKVPGD
jgi:hypothetical protein